PPVVVVLNAAGFVIALFSRILYPLTRTGESNAERRRSHPERLRRIRFRAKGIEPSASPDLLYTQTATTGGSSMSNRAQLSKAVRAACSRGCRLQSNTLGVVAVLSVLAGAAEAQQPVEEVTVTG